MSRFALRPEHPLAQHCVFASLLDHDLIDLVSGRHGAKVGSPTLITTPEGRGWQSPAGTSYVEWPDSNQFNLDRAATGVMRVRIDGSPAGFMSHDNGSGNASKWLWGKNLTVFGFSAAPSFHINNGVATNITVAGTDFTAVAGRYYTVAFSRLDGLWAFYLDGVPWGTATNNTLAFGSANITATFKLGYTENTGGLVGVIAWARLYKVWKAPGWHSLIARDPYADLRTRVRGVAEITAPIASVSASDSLSLSLTDSGTISAISEAKTASDSLSVSLTEVGDSEPIVPIAKAGTDSVSVSFSESAAKKVKIPGVATDDFNRASLGGDWTAVTPASAFTIASNRATNATSTVSLMVWAADLFLDDHTSQVTLAGGGSGTGTNYAALLLRANSTTGFGYVWWITPTSAVLYRMDGTTNWFALGKNVASGSVSGSFAVGDVIKADITNNVANQPVFKLYKNGVQIWTTFDDHVNKITSGGRPGIGFHSAGTPWELDDFEATGLAGELITVHRTDDVALTLTETATPAVFVSKTASDSLGLQVTDAGAMVVALRRPDTLTLPLSESADLAVSYLKVAHAFTVTVPQIDRLSHTFRVITNQQVDRLLHMFHVREQWGGRLLAHTFRIIAAGRVTPTLPYYVTTFPDPDANLAYIAQPGASAPPPTIVYVQPAPSTALSVGVVGSTITVTLATDASGAVTSTANAVVAAIEAASAASALVAVDLAPGSDGTGIVPAMPSRILRGTPLIERDILKPVSN